MKRRMLGVSFRAKTIIAIAAVIGLLAAQDRTCAKSDIGVRALLEVDPLDISAFDPKTLAKDCTTFLSESKRLSDSERGRLYILRGQAYLNASRYKDALRDFEQASELLPERSFDILLARNYVIGSQGLLERASSEVSDLIKTNPKSARAYLNKATWLLAIGDCKSCITCCDRSIALDKANPTSFFIRAKAHDLNRNYQKALDDINMCIKLGGCGVGTKFASQPYIARGILLLDPFDNPVRAFRDFTLARQLDPTSLEVEYGICGCYFKQGKYDIADYLSRRIIKEHPQEVMSSLIRITVLIQRGNINDALRLSERIVSLAPNLSVGYRHRGLVHFANGEFETALQDFEKASVINDENLGTMGAKSYLLASVPKLRNGGEALKLALRCCEESGYKNAQFLMLLAMSYSAAGHKSNAVKFGEKALERLSRDSHFREEYERRLKSFKKGEMYNYSPRSKVFDYLFF